MDRNEDDIWYVIDDQDHLVEASSPYFEFAAANDMGDAEAAIGRSLWDSVAGRSVREVQRALVRRIRRSGTSVAIPFRCDGPDARREKILRIEPAGQDGRLLFSSRPLEEQHRKHRAILEPGEPWEERTVTMCSWCGRVKDGSEWVDIERAAEDIALNYASQTPRISQDLCDRCVLVLAAT